jgi:hypothetical protein|eukprot:COSAG06_NODE_3560_length_5184_cov_2.380728_4_plen_58_part_00
MNNLDGLAWLGLAWPGLACEGMKLKGVGSGQVLTPSQMLCSRLFLPLSQSDTGSAAC